MSWRERASFGIIDTDQLRFKTPINTLIAALTVTRRLHANGKTNLLSLLAGFAVTLPAANGSGDKYRFVVGIVNTSNNYKIQVTTTDIIQGSVLNIDTDTGDATKAFASEVTSDTVTLNGTTTGGFAVGDWVEVEDIKTGVWACRGVVQASGIVATPFSAAV